MKKSLVLGAIGSVFVLSFVWACDDASSKDAGTQSDASSDGAFDAPEPVELPDDSVPLADLSSGVLKAVCEDILAASGFTRDQLVTFSCLGQLFHAPAEEGTEPPSDKAMCESALAMCAAVSPITEESAASADAMSCEAVKAKLQGYAGDANTGDLRNCLRETNAGIEAAAALTCDDALEDPNRLRLQLSSECSALLAITQ